MISNGDSDRATMDCARVVRDEITEQYVAGRLREDDQITFEQHYFQCDRCFEELKNYRALRAELERLSASPRRFPALTGRRLLWAGAGAAAVFAITLLTLQQTRVPEPTTPTTPAVEATPPITLAELGAVDPPSYQATTLTSTPDPAARTFRDAMRDYERRDYAASAKGLTAAARLDPSSPQAHFYLGVSHLLSGDSDAAVRALQTTIDLGQSAYLEDARFFLSKALIRRGNLDEARTELLKIALLKTDRERDARSLLAALDAFQPKVAPKGSATAGIDARVIRVDGTRAYINIGALHGVGIGDTFSVVHRGEQTGTGIVVEVQERFAIINISGTAVAADVIKKM